MFYYVLLLLDSRVTGTEQSSTRRSPVSAGRPALLQGVQELRQSVLNEELQAPAEVSQAHGAPVHPQARRSAGHEFRRDEFRIPVVLQDHAAAGAKVRQTKLALTYCSLNFRLVNNILVDDFY